VCRVGDSGPGVPPDASGRIFDPFFTTKAPGEGTGLGLANARRFAEEMGGSVELDAEPCVLGGALFHFRMPCQLKTPPSEVEAMAVRGDAR
jgi:signal transduction histidine kinase